MAVVDQPEIKAVIKALLEGDELVHQTFHADALFRSSVELIATSLVQMVHDAAIGAQARKLQHDLAVRELMRSPGAGLRFDPPKKGDPL